ELDLRPWSDADVQRMRKVYGTGPLFAASELSWGLNDEPGRIPWWRRFVTALPSWEVYDARLDIFTEEGLEPDEYVRIHGPANWYRLIVPLWIPLLLTAAPLAAWRWRSRHSLRPGACHRCGYNLTANESGKCPECGTSCLPQTGAPS